MIPQILMNVIQTSGKYFFDLDPLLTEHITRGFLLRVADIAQHSADALTQFSSRCAAGFAPLAEELRTLKMSVTQT